jgi:hypothetical protein
MQVNVAVHNPPPLPPPLKTYSVTLTELSYTDVSRLWSLASYALTLKQGRLSREERDLISHLHSKATELLLR